MPGLPLTPTLSIFFNLYLMFLLDFNTWMHFLLWMVAGNPLLCISYLAWKYILIEQQRDPYTKCSDISPLLRLRLQRNKMKMAAVKFTSDHQAGLLIVIFLYSSFCHTHNV